MSGTSTGTRTGTSAGTGRHRRAGTSRWRWLLRGLAVPIALAVLATAGAPAVVRVHRGDSLWLLARQNGTTVDELKRLNHLPSDTIYAGDTLLVPTPGRPRTGGALPARRGYPATVTASAARHRQLLRARTSPSRQYVRMLIRRNARLLGVDPALALAVAQQESGFQQNVVSPANAIGVMQVLPSTGRWLSREVLGRPLDLLDAGDNVLAGVALLRVLARAAPVRLAVAGYYQGLQSVRRSGMFADTKRYVTAVLALRRGWR